MRKCVDGWMGECVIAAMRSLPLRPDGCALSGQGCGAFSRFTFHGSTLLKRLLAEPLGFLRCVYPDSSGLTPVEMTGGWCIVNCQ